MPLPEPYEVTIPGPRGQDTSPSQVPRPEGEPFWHCPPGPQGACMASPRKGAGPGVREPLALLLLAVECGPVTEPQSGCLHHQDPGGLCEE